MNHLLVFITTFASIVNSSELALQRICYHTSVQIHRRFFARLATGSFLILCLAPSLFWLRSYFFCDGTGMQRIGPGFFVNSWHGRIFVGRIQLSPVRDDILTRLDFKVAGIPARFSQSKLAKNHAQIVQHYRTTGAIVLTSARPDFPIASFSNGWGFGSSNMTFSFNVEGTRFMRTDAWTVPWWPIWTIITVPSATFALTGWLSRRKRVRRMRLKLCAQCGYDLRASPDRCPECGMLANTK